MLILLFSTTGSAHAEALGWNTFLGGGSTEYSNAIAVDGSGNTYVTGYGDGTWGSPVRAFSSGSDAFVAKVAGDGTLVWNTFLGGSGVDNGYGIAADSSGNIVVTGYSNATWGTPLRAYTAGINGFVAKLDAASGELVWSTFLGGSGSDYGMAITVDGSGYSYVTGYSGGTWGTPVQAYTAGDDAFAAKIADNGTLVWNTFFGGGGHEWGKAIAVDESGSIFVAGLSTAAWGAPVRAYTAGYDAFAAKLSSNGTLAWNTFLGGSGDDYGYGIAVDRGGSIFVAGTSGDTWGTPVRAYDAGADAFAAKLDASGTLAWDTFLGGSGNDEGDAIAVDKGGNIFVAGYSLATWGSPVRPYTADHDAVAAQLADNGTLVWNTFLGGSGNDNGYGIAVSSIGNLYVTGRSEATWGAPVRAYTAGGDVHVTKLLMAPPVQAGAVRVLTQLTQADLSWTRGSGEHCAVFMREGYSGSPEPVDGTTYTANAAFGSGPQLGSTGWFCVYNGDGASVTVAGLSADARYRIMVCEYNGAAGSELYNSSAADGNPATFSILRVFPKTMHKMLSLVEPVKAFVLIGPANTSFSNPYKPAWGSTAIKQLLNLRISHKAVLAVVFANPFALTPGLVSVTIGDCTGSVEVKAL